MAEIIETKGKFENFINDVNSSLYIDPFFKSSEAHFSTGELSFLYVYSIKSEGSYIISIDHYESLSELSESSLKAFKDLGVQLLTSSKKELCGLYSGLNELLIDVEMLNYVATGEDLGKKVNQIRFKGNIHKRPLKNDIWHTPLYQIEKECFFRARSLKEIYEKHKSKWLHSKAFRNLNFKAIPVFSKLEASGLSVNRKRFLSSFKEKGKKNISRSNIVYPYYYFYTKTGRPSNSNGGVNFAALQKDDGSRNAFVSRFKDGRLVSFDFDAFHLRLISSLIDYNFSKDESVHNELGKIYFNKDSLTKDEYRESKRQSFKWLYGRIPRAALKYQYFKKVQEFIDRLWMAYKKYNAIRTPLYNRKIQNISNATPNKVFNYMLQAYETEVSIETIRKAIDSVRNKKTKLILYTYDSFLFDFPQSELCKIDEIKDSISTDCFPMDGEIGKHYGKMNPID